MNSFEQFSEDELTSLRDELKLSGLDTFQTAEMLAAFLAQHGYGASQSDARASATRMEQSRYALPQMQAELERLAWVM